MNEDFRACVQNEPAILMEGALGERLKREYGLDTGGPAAMAGLVRTDPGRSALKALWSQYLEIAQQAGLPFLAATPTRRANRQRLADAGLDGGVIAENTALLASVRAGAKTPMYIGGLMGCAGDAYTAKGCLTQCEAARFHCWQAQLFAQSGVDYLMAGIMPALPETLGMATAMSETGLPYLISFTITASGRLIDGTPIDTAIAAIDDAQKNPPAGYMTNCVHPSIVYEALAQPVNRTARVRSRFLGIQANTCALPYDQMDGSAQLLTAPPQALARDMMRLRDRYGLRIFGGCCGTDQRHLQAVAHALVLGQQRRVLSMGSGEGGPV